MWRCTVNGIFNIKSAYHLQGEIYSITKGQSSQGKQNAEEWIKLYKLSLPPTTKTFMWRACLNILPTKLNLCKNKILADPLCPLCS